MSNLVSVLSEMLVVMMSGTVWVNCYLNLDAAAAFGGYKLSGWGRENVGYQALESSSHRFLFQGAEGLENYLETKSIMWPVDETII